MTTKYSRLATDESDVERGSVFNYKSPFQFRDPKLKFTSIFTYKPQSNICSTHNFQEIHQEFGSKVFVAVFVLLSWLLFILSFPLSIWFCLKNIKNQERLLVFRLGRVHSVRGPGYVLLLPCIERWQKAYVGTRAFSVPPQQLISSDGAIVEVGANVQYRITNVLRSIVHVKNLEQTFRILSRSLFVNCLCKKTLHQLQNERLFICEELLNGFNAVTCDWGVNVENVEISHVKILKQSEPTSILKNFLSPCQMIPSEAPRLTTELKNPEESNISPVHCLLKEFVNTVSNSGVFIAEDIVIKLEVIGQTMELFYIFFEKGEGRIGCNLGILVKPDVSIRVGEGDLRSILLCDLTPLQAYIGGRMQIEGNVQTLMKLETAMQLSSKYSAKDTVITV